jgi:hypothetical protein
MIMEPHPQAQEMISDLPYDFYLSQNQFEQLLTVENTIKGEHDMLGLTTQMCTQQQWIRLVVMVLSTPGSHMPIDGISHF